MSSATTSAARPDRGHDHNRDDGHDHEQDHGHGHEGHHDRDAWYVAAGPGLMGGGEKVEGGAADGGVPIGR